MYRIGQFRKSQIDQYYNVVPITFSQKQVSTTTNGGITFYDICGNLAGNDVVNSNNSYFLRFGVKQRIDSEQKFNLKLVNTAEAEDNEQYLQEYTVPMGNSFSYFEIIFTPNSTYNQIIWELQRTILDYKIQNVNSTKGGRIMNIDFRNFSLLKNVITFLKSQYPNLTSLSKIGVQGPPSMLMCINGEQIRIGNSGIYEINNDAIKITFLGFIPKTAPKDYFIVDFEY